MDLGGSKLNELIFEALLRSLDLFQVHPKLLLFT